MPRKCDLVRKLHLPLRLKKIHQGIILACLVSLTVIYIPLLSAEPVIGKGLFSNQFSFLTAQADRASELSAQGQQLYEAGQFSEAVEVWEQAALAYAQAGDAKGSADTQVNRASALKSLGRYPQACKALLQAIDISNVNCQQLTQLNSTNQGQQDALLKALTKQPKSLTLAIGLRSLGDTLQQLDSLELAEKVLQLSLKAAQDVQSSEDEKATRLSLGNIYIARGNRERTEQNALRSPQSVPWRCMYKPSLGKPKKYYQQAASFYQQVTNGATSPTLEIQAQLNRINVLLLTDARAEAEDLIPQIQSKLKQLPNSRTTIAAQLSLASSLSCLEQAKEAESPSMKIAQTLATTANQAEEIGDLRGKSYALGYLGSLYAQNQQWKIASDLTQEALALAKATQSLDAVYEWQWQLGYLLKNQADIIPALAAYTEAVKTLESLKSDLIASSSNIQFDFHESVEPVYRQLIDLLLQPNEVSQSHLKQARDTIEALKVAELENLLRCNLQVASPVLVDEIADPKAAVIYPIVLDDRIEVIVSLPSQSLHHYSSSLPPKLNVENLLLRLSQNLQSPNDVGLGSLKLSQQLYDWLLRPIEAELAKSGVETLVFVLDAPLRQLPMALLHDGKQYLVEKYAPVLSPSQKLMQPKAVSEKNLKVLAAGISQKIPNFSAPALPEVKYEISQISQMTDSTVVLNQDFTKNTLQTKINQHPFSVVHLATHGQFSSVPNQTYIRTWDDRIGIDQLRVLLQSRESSLSAPIEILVLSACDTAEGDKKAALGLAGVAVRAGARSTLASLWQVGDNSTAELMTKFYQQLSNSNESTITKAKALQNAQLELLHKYKAPYHWAGYVLVGNWF